jgi:hypothetical protein
MFGILFSIWKKICFPKYFILHEEIRSTCLCRLYIDKTITILNSIHRPVFYMKHMMNVSTPQEAYYVSATEPKRLMPSIGLWRRYIDISITILNIIHCPVFYFKYTMIFRTSQETHYVSATSPTG